MTEQNEAPKRKRRTKEEIEAAKANGTYKPRARKKAEAPTEETNKAKQEPKAPEEHTAVPTKKVAPENKVLIMSCLNPTVAKAAMEAAKAEGVEVVILEDRVIHDYLEVRNRKEKQTDLGAFLNNTSNRLHAEDQAVKLWALLTGGKPIENAEERIFTRTEVVKKTSLTHGTADKLFQLFKAFGMIEFTKGSHEFKLHFNKMRCHQTIQTEILALCNVLNGDIVRFKASIDADEDLTKEKRDEMYKGLQESIDSTIEY